ncbi:MAG TPA: chemotaxis protein CheB [Luteimonas sp.]|nr:chemotaxis protein CheB [Luteimonas sp.]
MAEPVRVALLARPGTACEHLQAALAQAGADIVLVADPLGSDASAVTAASPRAVLVALDPAVEDVLDRYDPVLLDPAMTVIYDEAELAAKREGWDAARWTRHLAAKLAGHEDVLPPGAGPEPATRVDAAPEPAAPEPAASEPVLEAAPEPVVETTASSDEGISFSGIVPDGELSLDALEFDPSAATPPEPEPAVAASASAAAEERPTFDFSSLSLEEIPEERAAAPEPTPAPEPEPEPAPEPAAQPAFAAAPEPPPVFAAPATMPAEPGAVVVLAGIGGPDAVRQFLGALPDGFPRPVLVRQRLDGGRHDRLVRQMQRATSLPVELAEAGAPLMPGHVYILPDGMASAVVGDASHFVAADDPVPVLAGQPAAGSAILMLSGSDPDAVAQVQAAAAEGALVAGQSPEDCFDSTAAAALIATGAEAAAPAELAARVVARWTP